jgi:MFS transporter, DHA1 family, multidrug resistance protein
MHQRNYRNVLFISLSQFGTAFSFNFVMVFLPFVVYDISPYSSKVTLIWMGFIMAAPNFAAALASPFWGSLASRHSAKTIFMGGLLSHAIIVFLMGFVSSLPLLLGFRIIQGIFGGISTVGLIIVSSSSSREWAPRDIGLFQNAVTLGQLSGPPLGALAATSLGYKGAFISASGLVFITLAFCYYYVRGVPIQEERSSLMKGDRVTRKLIVKWGVCFVSTIQLMFLPSVLPDVFRGFHVKQNIAINLAGLVVMLYTAAAMAGTYLLCRLAVKVTSQRLILILCFVGTLFQFSLLAAPEILSFVAFRMLQTAMIAAVIPLVFSSCTSESDGWTIGFLNSSRFAGNALGPMIATFVLAFSNLDLLYVCLGSMGLLTLASYALSFAKPTSTDG